MKTQVQKYLQYADGVVQYYMHLDYYRKLWKWNMKSEEENIIYLCASCNKEKGVRKRC